MNTRVLLTLCSLLFLFSPTAHGRKRGTNIPNHPARLVYPAFNWEVPLGTSFRSRLNNGLRTYLAEDRTLPLVSIKGYIAAGLLEDPDGKEGLGVLAARLIRYGGTTRFPADSLEKIIERLAISLSISANETDLQFSLNCLSEFADTALLILSEMLFSPAFEEAVINRERSIVLKNMRHRFDNPEPILGAAYEVAMYGNQANSRLATPLSIENVTRQDMIEFHQRVMHSGQILLSMTGDMDRDTMAAHLTALFPASRDTVPLPPPMPRPEIRPAWRCLVIHKPLSQVYIKLGFPFVQRPDSGYYPMSLLNYVLGGGGFTSRLGTRIRSDEGLTYSIHSSAGSNYMYPATVSVSFFTKYESFHRAMALTLEEIDRILTSGITSQELNDAQRVLIDGLPSMFRSPRDIAETYAWNEYYGRSQDHFRLYPGEIMAIDTAACLDAAKRYLDTGKMIITIVGDTSLLFQEIPENPFSLNVFTPRHVTTPDDLPALSHKRMLPEDTGAPARKEETRLSHHCHAPGRPVPWSAPQAVSPHCGRVCA